MAKVFKTTAPKLAVLGEFAKVIQTGTQSEIAAALAVLTANPMFATKGWQYNFAKLARVIAGDDAQYSIFKLDGNSKLPFVAFSSLPGVTCPGAGACLEFCYSYRAWRYPAAVMRQCQNAYLLRFAPGVIADALRTIPGDFDLRLYVDGDFSSTADVSFWMGLLSTLPNIRAYGYSKSFDQLLAYKGAWPSNYMLNISSGHNSPDWIVSLVRDLPITRGEFIALSIGKKPAHGSVDTNRALRAAAGDTKIFPCPGQCGSCTGAGHACGLPAMRGRVIAIALH
jgi:hypothetical protein